MRYESVCDLKTAMLAKLRRHPCAGDVALGITPARQPQSYRLAVRVTRMCREISPIVDSIERTAANEIDLRISMPVAAHGNGAEEVARSLAIGAGVAHVKGSTGTLGFFARRKGDGAAGLVSCNHVIAASDTGCDGDEVLRSSGRHKSKLVAGYLDGTYPRLHGVIAAVDCAFAKLSTDAAFEPSKLRSGRCLRAFQAPAWDSAVVEKIGRTTGHTVGKVTAFELDPVVNYPMGATRLHDMIEVEAMGEGPFSLGGDSGSLVFTPDGHPLGMLCANSVIQLSAHELRLAYITPLTHVLHALDVEMIC